MVPLSIQTGRVEHYHNLGLFIWNPKNECLHLYYVVALGQLMTGIDKKVCCLGSNGLLSIFRVVVDSRLQDA